MDRRSFLLAASAAAATATFTRACAASAKTPLAFGAVPDGTTDNTTALQAMLDAAGDIRWTAGAYRSGRLILRSGTRITFDPGVAIRGIEGQKGLLAAPDAEDLTLQGPADIFGPPGMLSHTVNLSGVKRATLQGLKIGGGSSSGGGKDALYVGPGTKGPSEDVHIDGCALHDALRNGISITACRGFIVENCDISGAHGSPGSGIDVEANQHGVISGGVIRNNRVHDNQRYGVIVAFGDGVQIYGNEVTGNGLSGIVVAAGAAQWNEGVYRSGVDIVSITGFDPATGRVFVSDAANIEVGTVVSFQLKNGAQRPVELGRQSRNLVIDKDPAGQWLLLSTDGYTPVGRLTGASWGALHRDPAKTDIRLRVYAEGQASNVEIYGNTVHGNGSPREIDVSVSVGVRVHDNDITAGPDRMGVYAVYARRLSVFGNRIHGDLASSGANSRGLSITSSSHVEHHGNQIDSFGYAGVLASGIVGYDGEGDTLTNCGWQPKGAAVQLERIRGGRLAGEVVRNDPDHPATFGIYAPTATLADTVIENNDLSGSGASPDAKVAIVDPAAKVGVNTL
jgi:hypothetical protein